VRLRVRERAARRAAAVHRRSRERIAALAGTASAATFEKGPVLGPGATIPVDFPGCREPESNKLKGGYRIVEVRAALARDEHATTTITAPRGFKLVTLAFDHASQLGARTENAYVGKRSVRLTLFADRNRVAAGQLGHATVYALARRGGF
jgi:hypothetical protein